jgi:hypothetical protein
MYFVQGLPQSDTPPWGRIAVFVALAMLPEIVAKFTGNITYGRGWNLPISVTAHLPTWLCLWFLHRFVMAGKTQT